MSPSCDVGRASDLNSDSGVADGESGRPFDRRMKLVAGSTLGVDEDGDEGNRNHEYYGEDDEDEKAKEGNECPARAVNFMPTFRVSHDTDLEPGQPPASGSSLIPTQSYFSQSYYPSCGRRTLPGSLYPQSEHSDCLPLSVMHPAHAPSSFSFDNIAFKMDMDDLKRQMEETKNMNEELPSSFDSGCTHNDVAPSLSPPPRAERRRRTAPYSIDDFHQNSRHTGRAPRSSSSPLKTTRHGKSVTNAGYRHPPP